MPTLCLVEVTQLRTIAVAADSVIFKLKKCKTAHFLLSRRHASFDFHQILHSDRGGPCRYFRLKNFFGIINYLAARVIKIWLKTPPSM